MEGPEPDQATYMSRTSRGVYICYYKSMLDWVAVQARPLAQAAEGLSPQTQDELLQVKSEYDRRKGPCFASEMQRLGWHSHVQRLCNTHAAADLAR